MTGAGLEELKDAINGYLHGSSEPRRLHIPPEAGKFRASLFQQGAVCEEYPDEFGGWVMEVKLDPPSLQRLCRDHDMDLSSLQ